MENKKNGFEIIGGQSKHKKISMWTDEFISTAQCLRNGEDIIIGVEVNLLPPENRFLLKHKYLPIPQILRLLLFATSGMSLWKKILFYALAYFFLSFFSSFLGAAHAINPILPPVMVYISVIALFVCSLCFIKDTVAKWHGAEHKAIAAYDHGSTEIADTAKESRIHDKCGGGLYFPMVLMPIIASRILGAMSIYVNFLIIFLLATECVLWIDKLIGWDKIPVFRETSRLLQRYVTTEEPGEIEILTAKAAIDGLKKMYRQED